jgi:hypothetical protein
VSEVDGERRRRGVQDPGDQGFSPFRLFGLFGDR